MNTKLTLSMDKEVIVAAKKYAGKKKTSVSSLVENYLDNIVNKDTPVKEDISPLVKSLSGVMQLHRKQDQKKRYVKYLAEKYK